MLTSNKKTMKNIKYLKSLFFIFIGS
ncbi:MAG: hypothetical protein RLY43_67, partial [Bacteroidota bacterium]